MARETMRSYSQDAMLGAGPRIEAWARSSRQGGVPKPEPRGQESPQMEPRPVAEAPAKRRLSQKGDLHGGTAGGQMTPHGGCSGSWGRGMSPAQAPVKAQGQDSWCKSQTALPPLGTLTWPLPRGCRLRRAPAQRWLVARPSVRLLGGPPVASPPPAPSCLHPSLVLVLAPGRRHHYFPHRVICAQTAAPRGVPLRPSMQPHPRLLAAVQAQLPLGPKPSWGILCAACPRFIHSVFFRPVPRR